MYLELELAEGERLTGLEVRANERRESVKLPTLDVDLENIDVLMAVHRQERAQRVHRRRVVRPVCIASRKAVRCKVRATEERGVVRDLRPEALNGEVVPPDLAVRGAREEVALEGGLVVDADGVDDTRLLGLEALEAADPLAAIAERTDALDGVRAGERGGDKVPDSVGRPGLRVRGKPGTTINSCQLEERWVDGLTHIMIFSRVGPNFSMRPWRSRSVRWYVRSDDARRSSNALPCMPKPSAPSGGGGACWDARRRKVARRRKPVKSA